MPIFRRLALVLCFAVLTCALSVGLVGSNAARGDDGTVLTSSWVDGQAQPLPISEEDLLPGLADSLVGMQVGGRRVITLPYDPDSGLTPETDVVIIADLLYVS